MSVIFNLRRGTEQQIIDAQAGGVLGQSELLHATDIDKLILNGVGGLEYFGSVTKDNDVSVLATVYKTPEVETTANAIAVNTNGTFVYEQGKWFFFVADANTTAPTTMSVDGGAPLVLKDKDGVELSIEAGVTYLVSFQDSTTDFFEATSGASGGVVTGRVTWTDDYQGTSQNVKDLDGNDITVSVGDFIYSEGDARTKISLGQQAIDRTALTQVFNSRRDMAGQGRKLIRLASGRLINVYGTTSLITFMKSDDTGLTWQQLCTCAVSNSSYGLATDGTTVMLAYIVSNGDSYSVTINGDTQVDEDIAGNVVLIHDGFSGGVSIDVVYGAGSWWTTFVNDELTPKDEVKWSRSVDDGVTWSTAQLIANETTENAMCTDSNGNPIVVYIRRDGSNLYSVWSAVYNGVSWDAPVQIYNAGAYFQTNPSVECKSTDEICVAWHGYDAIAGLNNLRYSNSTDAGSSWSAMAKLTANTDYGNDNVSVCINDSDEVFLVYRQETVALGQYVIDMQVGDYGSFVKETIVQIGTQHDDPRGSRFRSFEKPLVAFKGSTELGGNYFYGKWTDEAFQEFLKPSESSSALDFQAQAGGTLMWSSPNTGDRVTGFKDTINHF